MEFAPRLMAVQIDDAGGAMLRRKIEDLGVIVHTSKNTSLITDGEQCVNKMCFADGEELETDIILFSAGIRPRDELARAPADTEQGRGAVCPAGHRPAGKRSDRGLQMFPSPRARSHPAR